MACSAAVNQLKQANKESSVEAKEEKTATVDTTEDGEEEEDKKPAAVQRVEPNEVAQLGIVPEGEEHQIVRDGTVNICVKWNYKEMGVFLPAGPIILPCF